MCLKFFAQTIHSRANTQCPSWNQPLLFYSLCLFSLDCRFLICYFFMPSDHIYRHLDNICRLLRLILISWTFTLCTEKMHSPPRCLTILSSFFVSLNNFKMKTSDFSPLWVFGGLYCKFQWRQCFWIVNYLNKVLRFFFKSYNKISID